MSFDNHGYGERPRRRRPAVRRGGASGGAGGASRRRMDALKTLTSTTSGTTSGTTSTTAPSVLAVAADTSRVSKPGHVAKAAAPEKPVWMSDAQYEQATQSIVQAVEAVKENVVNDDQVSTPNSDAGPTVSAATTTTESLAPPMAPMAPMASEDVNVKIKYLKQLQAEGKDEIVRDFYNTQTFHSRQSKRTESPIYRLRSFNNCIKYILINKYGRSGGNVLELGCGKGGDLAKWEMVGTRLFVGVDLSDESIREAIKRYRQRRYGFGAVFATGDAFQTQLPTILKDFSMEEVGGLQFDNVSMQFCMHYAFSSEESVMSMLQNVSRSLKVGGMFVGTIPSSDFIKWKLNKLKGTKETSWGNELYRVTFPDLDGYDFEKRQFKKPFGNVYNYFLKDAVEDVPEYVVPFEKFRALCEEHGLELRYKKNFFDMFNKEVGPLFAQLPGPLVQSLRRPDGTYGVDGSEREACSFYLAFAFERV